jgi:hypothetical protein
VLLDIYDENISGIRENFSVLNVSERKQEIPFCSFVCVFENVGTL